MRSVIVLLVYGSLGGCSVQPQFETPSSGLALVAAEELISAFYSFDPDILRRELSSAPSSMPEILYYQGWAEGGAYVVIERKPCRFNKPNEVRCEITVKDDLIAALGTGFHVTDTFHLELQDERVVKVWTSSNDPPEFKQALDWLRRERPELLTGPCRGFFAGGPTPQDCVREVIKGFADFKKRTRPKPS